MKTLSFYPSYDFSSHDLNLSLVENSNILYSYEESKLSKTLHREAKFFPDRTILNCFNTLKILPKEIDQVCIVGGKNSKLIKPFLWNIEKYFGLNKKMPLFQEKHLFCMNFSAVSKFGFSINLLIFVPFKEL